ncbi:DUF4097 family beta strand repeat-containing protein [Streptomyces lasiicapitis]|uniref:DUF4097 family beta strand repeat-containing protein n=1 Tax=Streptomyces TaxID=1883 RepID=UPI0013D96EA5|nr:DUF4097 family beta strand repeat-containing protein [Streptomyces aureoverticillatus]QIB42419.1 DUF4097 domain-containing protein [Streptomyces aureoverticillatus]
MPVFETPQPISVTIDLVIGDARIEAGARADTVVEVSPSDPGQDADVRAAERTRVECADGRLLVKAPRHRAPFGRVGSVTVTIGLPSGSALRGSADIMALRVTGRLGACRFKTSAGDIRLARTGSLVLASAVGDIAVDRVEGSADLTTGTGSVRIREVTGPAVIRNLNGDSWVGEVTGELRLNAANGAISVEKAHTAVAARTANGDIRIGEVVRGSVVLGTSAGRLDVGIGAGTAALLDVWSHAGNVHNLMTAAEGPGPLDETVEVRAGTSVGDVAVHRA